jgi:uncharacterized protein YndB with AHSA1/START domain
MTTIPDAMVTLRETIAAPRSRVYRAWTEPDELMRWFRPPQHAIASATIDLRVGGRYRFGFYKPPDGAPFYVAGEYRELTPGRIVFTWSWESPHAEVRDTLVTVVLLERPEGTEVILTHELLPNHQEIESHTKGWTAILRSLAETYAKENEDGSH